MICSDLSCNESEIKDYVNLNSKLFLLRSSFIGPSFLDSLKLTKQRMQSKFSPTSVDSEFIEMDLMSKADDSKWESIVHPYGHVFCAVPLEGYTYCDYCTQPIWKSDSRPVCKKCPDCYMTCHLSCVDKVQVHCDVSNRQSYACDYKYPSSNDPPILYTGPTYSQIDSTDDQRSESTDFCQCSTEDDGAYIACALKYDGLSNNITSPTVSDTLDTDTFTQVESLKNYISNCYHLINAPNDDRKSIASKSTKCTSTTDINCAPILIQSATHLSRHETDVSRLRKHDRPTAGKSHLSMRHSFLAPKVPNASIYSRLSYDFSSLDKRTIESEGILVKQFVASPTGSAAALVSANEDDSSAGVGLASVMQTTQAFVSSKSHQALSSTSSSSCSVPLIPMVVGPRAGNVGWSQIELDQLIDVFNTNEFGLFVGSRQMNNVLSNCVDCEGQIRIHINLLRPIQMELSSRPASIYDIVGSHQPNRGDVAHSTEDSQPPNPPRSSVVAQAPAFSSNLKVHPTADPKNLFGHMTSMSTFRLPRGSTKMLHVQLSTTALTVICTLLDRFGIKDNPHKFALYEHTIEGDQEVCVRKLSDDELPLGLFLKWVTGRNTEEFNEILNVKRLVLQENVTDDIEWLTFGLSELRMFLGILNREESEYSRQIEMKFDLRRKEIKRLMKLKEKKDKLARGSADATDNNLPTAKLNALDLKDDVQVGDYVTSCDIEAVLNSGHPTTLDSMSAPVSPLVSTRQHLPLKKENADDINTQPEDEGLYSPDMSSPDCTLNNKALHSRLSNAIMTLPRFVDPNCIDDEYSQTPLDNDSASATAASVDIANSEGLGSIEADRKPVTSKPRTSSILDYFRFRRPLRNSRLSKGHLKSKKKMSNQPVSNTNSPTQQQFKRWLGLGTGKNGFPWSFTNSSREESNHLESTSSSPSNIPPQIGRSLTQPI